jgi:S-adenosyl-L-methionine hydrolase (adenosine-forming)
MPRPVALLSDFGYRDAYAGLMKGVLLARCPGVQVVDLTHGVPAQDVLAGALYLLSAVPYFPVDTLFLAVVDPGVGGERRGVCLRSGGRLFVGPDNGLLWPAAASCGRPEAFHLSNPRWWLPEPGSTFHGRDIFSPVAAALAAGRAAEDLGPAIADPVRLDLPLPFVEEDGASGEVVLVDHFGSLVTNLRPADLGHPEVGQARFEVAGQDIPGPSTHYAAVPAGGLLVVLGSFGYYELAVNEGSAAQLLGIGRGARIRARTAR